jgi:hypothetical protein
MVRHIGEDEVWIEFEGHILNGMLAEVSLVKLEKTNMALRELKMQAEQHRWDKIRNTYSWKTFSAIRDVEWKLHRVFRPVFNKYENFLKKLRDHAESQYPLENKND